MTVTVSYVARNLGVPAVPTGVPGYTDMNGYPGGVVVGSDTALDSHDGDGSYVEIVEGPIGGSSAVTFQVRRAAGSPSRPPGSLAVSYVAYFDVWANEDNYFASIYTDGPEASGLGMEYGNVTSGTYEAQSQADDISNWPGPANQTYFHNGIDQFVDPATTWVFYGYFTHEPATTFRISYFRLDVVFEGGASPVRLLGRGDGLGAGSNRLIGPGTPQSSVRLLGSL